MIVVEGPDGSGKSTLVKRLSEQLQIPAVPSLGKLEPDLAIRNMEQMVLSLNPGVWDRCRAISEYIYGRVCRKTRAFHPFHWTWIYRVIRSGHQIVYCRPPEHVIHENVGNTDQPDWVKENLPAIIREYDRVMLAIRDYLGGDQVMFYYDYTNPSCERLMLDRFRHMVDNHNNLQFRLQRLEEDDNLLANRLKGTGQ